jgi:enamine deaminase RidA (YjgF/YER057c/UK114 family)
MKIDVYERLVEAGIVLPETSAPAGIYRPAREFGDRFLYTSGCGPNVAGVSLFKGKVGSDLTLEQGREAARACIPGILAAVRDQIGDLSRIKQVVKILAFVACDADFFDQPAVVDGASVLLVDLFGEEAGKGARSAIGTNVLPGNIPVEIEILFELH